MKRLEIYHRAGAVYDAIGCKVLRNRAAILVIADELHRDRVWHHRAVFPRVNGEQIKNTSVRETKHVRLYKGSLQACRSILRKLLNSATPPGGTATITLPNGRFLQCAVRGSHSASQDTTKLGLRPFGNSLGTKLTLRLASTNAVLTDLSGRVFGQKLDEHDLFALPQQNAD